jgi:hypothetical protein
VNDYKVFKCSSLNASLPKLSLDHFLIQDILSVVATVIFYVVLGRYGCCLSYEKNSSL